jgi:hypothetical protein
MRNNVATLCARVGIAALASLGVFALPGGAASAAPSLETAAAHSTLAAALTPEQCDAIQQQIDGLNARVLTLQDMLADASPAVKASLIKMIRKLEAQISVLEAQLAGCPA